MAESIQKELDLIHSVINALETSIPNIIFNSYHNDAIEFIRLATDYIEQISFDENMKELATTIKILNGGESPILKSVYYQSYILDILEMFSKIESHIQQKGLPSTTRALELCNVGEFLINIAARVTNRYKLKILFNPEFEAKYLRAFMLVKDLHGSCRFLSMSPDITVSPDVNLDSGLELEVLSQETPQNLHKIAGAVLDVQSVQIFVETKSVPTLLLDPPHDPNSFDNKISTFLSS